MGEQPSEDTITFSVLTWNVWFGSKAGWDCPEKRWTHLLQTAVNKNPDVIGFQECTSKFLHIMETVQCFQENYVVINEPPKGYSYFVMVYVKKSLKAKSKETILLKTNLGRRCEAVTLENDNMCFRFGTVHIESYVTSKFVREIQMHTIFDALIKKSSGLELVFVVGDFNFDETEVENKVIDESVFCDTWPNLNPDQKGWTYSNAVNATEVPGELVKTRIDRVLYCDPKKRGWRPVTCELLGTESIEELSLPGVGDIKLYPSDHFGLFAIYERQKNSLLDGANCTCALF